MVFLLAEHFRRRVSNQASPVTDCKSYKTMHHRRCVTEDNKQGDHSPDTLKFPDVSLTMCDTQAHVKWYS